jgi:hypothetical protein
MAVAAHGILVPQVFEQDEVGVNTGVTKIVIGAAGTSLISLNDHSHLEEVDRSLVTYR